MSRNERVSDWIFGAFLGALLGGTYALVSQAVNWIFLPDLPLAPPSGTFSSYLLQWIFMGALLGCICAIPVNRMAGVVLGGVISTTLILLGALRSAWGSEFFGGTVILILFTFMPLIVLMLPIAFLIRLGIDARHVDRERPHLWARRYLIPAALILVVVLLGSLALYSKEQRKALQEVFNLIAQGQQSNSVGSLPEPLKDVEGFLENAQGSYRLAVSDQVDTFWGPRPVGSEMSQFLVIARYENGYAFACIFSANRPIPTCAVYYD